MRAVAQDALQDTGHSHPLSGPVFRSRNLDSGMGDCREVNRPRRSSLRNCNDLALSDNTHKRHTRLESPWMRK